MKNDYSAKPIKLIIKKHKKTGLKYLCKTIRENHNKYLGSGVEWRNHLHEHGYEIMTRVIFRTHSKSEFRKVAEMLSHKWNIVESNEWANMVIENGAGSSKKNKVVSEETKRKQSESRLKFVEKEKKRLGVEKLPVSQSTRNKISQRNKGRVNTPEQMERWYASRMSRLS